MDKKIKVLHITPTYFSPESVMGGGERYAYELAKAMSKYANTTMLSFGNQSKIYNDQDLQIIIKRPIFYIKNNKLNPFYLNLYKLIKDADVIHVHQIFNVLSEVSILWARILGKPIFLTDHGGGGVTYLTKFGITKLSTGILAVSEYSGSKLQHIHNNRFAIYGGVNTNAYFPLDNIQKIKNKIITIGRILPHKGYHHLIKAITDEQLTIIGQVSDTEYLKYLETLSQNKHIRFLHNLNDVELKNELASASLAVFPSTNKGVRDEELLGEPELLGIAPLEAMAMNIPTIVSDIGAYPEICFNKNSFMFENGNTHALQERIKAVLSRNDLSGVNFIEHVKSKFTWDKAAKKCLEIYKQESR